MKVNVSSAFLNDMCEFLGEIEIDGQFVSLYKLGRRTHYIVLGDSGSVYEFKSRKAANEFICKI